MGKWLAGLRDLHQDAYLSRIEIDEIQAASGLEYCDRRAFVSRR
jgi:hypothetical protein